MIESSKKIFSVCMVLLLLLSTISWKVEKHYCMGRLIDVAFFVDAEPCGMDMGFSIIDNLTNSCCDDELIIVNGQEDLKISGNDFNIELDSYTLVSNTSLIDSPLGFLEKLIPLELYPPPNLIKDIQLLDEVFLI